MKEPLVEAEGYEAAGFRDAHAKMREEIKAPFTPPSLDVFRFELKRRNRGLKTCTPEFLANVIIRNARDHGNASP